MRVLDAPASSMSGAPSALHAWDVMVLVDFELTVMSSPTSGRRLEMLKSATGGSGVGSLTVKRFSVEVDSPRGRRQDHLLLARRHVGRVRLLSTCTVAGLPSVSQV